MLLLLLLLIPPIWCKLECNDLLTTVLTGSVSNDTLETDEFQFKPNYFQQLNETHFRVCICEVRSCLRKCCPLGQIMNRMVCVDGMGTNFQPRIFNQSLSIASENETASMFLAPGVTCPKEIVTSDRVGVVWFDAYPLSNGSLLMPNTTAPNVLFKVEEFCLENFVFHDGKVYGPASYVCYKSARPSSYPTAYLVGMLLSIISLVATFAIYIILPELQNLPGKSVMCHTLSLTTSFLTVAGTRLGKKDYHIMACKAIGLAIASSTLSAFFWLSVMGFDIWWKFSRHGSYGKPVLGDDKKAFLLYSAYAWGMPVLLLLFTLSMDWIPAKYFPGWFIRPRFGLGRCWYSDKAKLYYFFAPIGLLVILNIIFYGITAFNLLKHRRQTSMLRKNRRGSDSDQQRIMLHLKLFLVMGLNWIMEVVIQLVDYNTDGYLYFKYACNMFNTCQGVFIFIIFICKKDIQQKLLAKFGPFWTRKEKNIVENWRKSASLHIASSGVQFKGTWKSKTGLLD